MQTHVDPLQLVLDSYVASGELPGANATIFVDGRASWSGTSGWKDAKRLESLPASSTSPAYSVTKTFAAACALRMDEEGEVDLDAPLSAWLPELHFAERVSLAQVLAHTGGIHDYGAMRDYHDAVAESPSTPWDFDEYVARTCERPLDFEPGEGWAYSNSGYTLVKRILELTIRGSFGEALSRYVLRPLDLSETFELAELADMDRVAPGHSTLFSSEGTLQDVRPVYHPGWCGTGVLASTGSDLCNFFDALFAGRLLSRASLERMLTLRRVPGKHPPSVSPCYGLGIMADPDAPHGPSFAHGGAGPGWDLYAGCVPNLNGRRVSVSVLCNQDGHCAQNIASEILDVIHTQKIGT